MTGLWTSLTLWWKGLDPSVKRWAGGLLALAVFGWAMFAWGGDSTRTAIEKEQAAAAARATKTTTKAQANLDGETRRIGEDVARAEARTVTIVERTKTEVRYEMAREADPLERLRIWRDRARELRDTLDIDGEPSADGASPAGSAQALRGTLAP